jgi:hypothetical protein
MIQNILHECHRFSEAVSAEQGPRTPMIGTSIPQQLKTASLNIRAEARFKAHDLCPLPSTVSWINYPQLMTCHFLIEFPRVCLCRDGRDNPAARPPLVARVPWLTLSWTDRSRHWLWRNSGLNICLVLGSRANKRSYGGWLGGGQVSS